MQKKNVVIGASLLGVMLLAGCQSISDQIGKKVAEGVIGQAVGGDVKLDDKNGSMTIKTKDGEATLGGGDTRPASVAADIPSLSNAKDFAWLGNSEGGMFTFKVDGTDLIAECGKEEAMVVAAGWQEKKDGFTMDSADFKTKIYNKNGKLLTVSCTKDEASVSIVLSTSKDTSVETNAEEDKTEPAAVESSEVKTPTGEESAVSTESLPVEN